MTQISRLADQRGVYRLTTELSLNVSRTEVFDFFADAYQLEQITPPWLHFSVLTPRPIEMHAGALIDYKLRLHGVPIHWRTRITLWEPPHRFVDEQIAGPYRLWRHLHTFEEIGGLTHCRDQVDYAVPGGPLIHQLLVKRDVRKIFDYRATKLKEIFQREDSMDTLCRVATAQSRSSLSEGSRR